MSKIYILGKDSRSLRLKEMYKKEEKTVDKIESAEIVVCPMPLSRNGSTVDTEDITCDQLIQMCKGKKVFSGAISKEMKSKFEGEKIDYVDMLDLEEVAILNSIPTAEGAISIAMEMTDFTLHDSNCLVMGYGRIGKVLAKMLSGVGANVYCEARSEKDLASINVMKYMSVRLNELKNCLPKMDIIFNTVPNLLLKEEEIQLLRKSSVIIDLASKPGGVDQNAASKAGINTVWALGLPGKVAPYTAAKYLKNTIDKSI
ncbi:MAG: dipicolinate synthase subunit DpsA [Clostridia bacterium]